MAIKLLWSKKWLDYTSVEWAGSHNQSSRQITFSLPANRYDKGFKNVNIKLGDIVSLYDGKTRLFLGVITAREKSAEIGTESYTARDFLHYLLRSIGMYKFKNKTPEQIAKQICGSVGIKIDKVATTGVVIPKMICEDMSLYDIIAKAYRKAFLKTGKRYLLSMNADKLVVSEKGLKSGITLNQSQDITGATYSDTTDNMVNLVKIYNDSMKQIGEVRHKDNIDKFGIYQSTYQKEDGVNANTEAGKMLVGVTREVSVSAIGYIEAVAGKSIVIKDGATGLKGMFYITNDSHRFENGTHMMDLDLAWKLFDEEASEDAEEKKGKKSKKKKGRRTAKQKVTPTSTVYYLKSGNVYHSNSSCRVLEGNTPKKTILSELLKETLKKGKNKGKSKYRACKICCKTD